MSKIYEVRSVARSNGKIHAWGARYSRAEAEALLAKQTENREWADEYHEQWSIEEIDTTGLFEIPPRPSPRERFSTKVTEVPSGNGTWASLRVDVVDETGRIVATYPRNYPNLYRTFEPFRQGDRMLALISTDYTATAVMDLSTGEVIAAEEPNSFGFCPAGFYVPDWWDIHDGSILPGSEHWRSELELPKGDFGFVWGCIWGDDTSWKVQYLDLTRVQSGTILRDERFGYVELASHPDLPAKDFIRCSFYAGKCKVTFSVVARFDLNTGEKLQDGDE
ncbi:MAG: hypothetical protein IPK82_34460 [Polyangiaceae bacterium]|nr:hypothetical protein [Polyangiaceae bacterium]